MVGKKTARKKHPAFDVLVDRVSAILAGKRGIMRKNMFGGACFLLRGNMACGVTGQGDLMVRVGKDAHDDALALPGARPMDFTGRPMRGFVFVAARHLAGDDELEAWVGRGLAHARSLPAK